MEWLVISALAFSIGAMLWMAYTVYKDRDFFGKPNDDSNKKP